MQDIHVDVYIQMWYTMVRGDIMASKAQIKANIKYNRSMDSITIRPSKEIGQSIRASAEAAGIPLQRYILQAVLEHMEREEK